MNIGNYFQNKSSFFKMGSTEVCSPFSSLFSPTMTSSVILNSPVFPCAIRIAGEEVIFKSCFASKSLKLRPSTSAAFENCRIRFHLDPKTGPEFPALSSPVQRH